MDNLNPLATLYDTNKAAIASAVDQQGVNRLCVNTYPAQGVAVSQPAIGSGSAAKTVFSWLSTGGGGPANSNMLVDGSTTPQVFYFTPRVATISVYYLRIIMSGGSFATSGQSFGGAGTGGLLGTNNPPTLSNGLLVSVTAAGVVTNLFNMTINEDFFAMNGIPDVHDTGAGIVIVGTMYFNQQLVLNSGDQVAVTVRDRLTLRNITSLRACFCGVRP